MTRALGVLGASALLVAAVAGPAVAAGGGGGDVRGALRTATEQGRGRVLPWFPNRNGPTVLTSGLNNPRQISLSGGDGVLLVAEAGKGGPTCGGVGEGGAPECVGDTGAVSTVFLPQFGQNRHHLTVVRGLFSDAGPDGSFATGSDGVSAKSLGDIKIVADQDGNLLQAHPFGPARVQAGIGAYERANDPDGQGPESNPYAVLALGDRTLVADAAGNDILSVAPDGSISVFALFPNITDGACAGLPNDAGTTGCDFVPTSLAQGRDGSIYVGALAAETPGAGRVVKLDPTTGVVLDTIDGLTTVTGVAVGRDGAVYASELFAGDPNAPGDLVKIAPDGTRTTKVVPLPAGVAVDRFNNVFVAAFSTAPDTGLGDPGTDSSGQIWRLRF